MKNKFADAKYNAARRARPGDLVKAVVDHGFKNEEPDVFMAEVLRITKRYGNVRFQAPLFELKIVSGENSGTIRNLDAVFIQSVWPRMKPVYNAYGRNIVHESMVALEKRARQQGKDVFNQHCIQRHLLPVQTKNKNEWMGPIRELIHSDLMLNPTITFNSEINWTVAIELFKRTMPGVKEASRYSFVRVNRHRLRRWIEQNINRILVKQSQYNKYIDAQRLADEREFFDELDYSHEI